MGFVTGRDLQTHPMKETGGNSVNNQKKYDQFHLDTPTEHIDSETFLNMSFSLRQKFHLDFSICEKIDACKFSLLYLFPGS